MGRPKSEMARIHAKNVKKAKALVKDYNEKKISFKDLSARAKHFLKKQAKAAMTKAAA